MEGTVIQRPSLLGQQGNGIDFYPGVHLDQRQEVRRFLEVD